MADIEDLQSNLSTHPSIFTLKIGHQNLLFCIGFTGLRHNSSLICYFPEIISILKKIYPNILSRLLILNLFMTH